MKKIKKAIVAVAGSGTRFLPATKSMPKEMLPIVDKPIIQYVVEELVEGGIEDIILVTRWDKKPLEDHFDHNWALVNDLDNSGKTELREEMQKISRMANFIYVRQLPEYGNGVPVLSAASIVKDEPFVFCNGDDVVRSEVPFTKQMIDVYNETGNMVMGTQEVPKEETYKYGILKLKEGTSELESIIEKPKVEEAPSQMVNIGRFILNQDVVNALKRTSLGKGNELWLVDAVTKYVDEGGTVNVKQIENGEWLTTGDPLNFLIANLKFAMDREDISDELKDFINKNYCK